jgi:hypothetical protein
MPLILIDCTAHAETPCHIVFDTDTLGTHAAIEPSPGYGIGRDMWQARFFHNGVLSRWAEPERFYTPEAALLQLERWHLAEIASDHRGVA